MRFLICDDDKRFGNTLKQLIYANLDELSDSIVEIVDSGMKLINYCNKNTIDILFLDIELGDINGIEIAKRIRHKFPDIIIVYISNYPDYVFSTFETEPLNFLTKPINKSEFNKTFQRIIKKYFEMHRSIAIKWQNDSVNLEINDICYIEGYNRHLVFRMYNGDNYEIVGKLDEYYNTLKEYGFVKSHQGYIVNMHHIKEFRESEIIMRNGDTVLMSVRRRLKTKEAYYNFINRR